DMLCDQDSPIILEKPTFPEPVISMSVEPKTANDKQKLGEALTVLKREDPTFQANYDEETGQTIIAGMGELHLEILRMRLTRDHKVDVVVGKPRVAYKETITRPALNVRRKHVKQSGRRGQYGDGSYHQVDSSQVAFELAGQLAFREACSKAGMTLLEPIMKVVVTTPEEFVGNVTGDLNRRRGLIVNSEQRGNTRVVEAEVPLS